DGATRWVHGLGKVDFDSDNNVKSLVGTIRDVTSRKEKEEGLRKLNRTLTALSKSSQAMSQSVEEDDYLKQVCKIVVEDTDFAMVWIGYAEDDEAKTIRPMASAGFNDNYLETIRLSWDDSEFGRGPTGVAIRTGNMGLCNNMLTDPDFEPWREQALKRGFASSIVFPLKTGDKTFGAFTIYSSQPDSFLDAEIKLLSKLANDLSHGITTIRLRAAHRLAEEALSKSHGELEILVKKRTHELQIANDLLKKEINIGKQQEQRLKIAEEKYRTVADFTYNWEFWIDQNDIMLYCSPSCERITGYKATEFMENSGLILNIVHPDDKNEYITQTRNDNNVRGSQSEFQFRIVRIDGNVRWLGHLSQSIYDKSGNYIGRRGSNEDITERIIKDQLLKTSNHKYELLSENITDGIFICRNGRFEYVNKALTQIFGFSDHELERFELLELLKTDSSNKLADFLSQNGSLSQILNIEIECLKKDRSVIFVEFVLNYIANEGAIYGVAHDITEKKQIQKNIVKAIIQTEEKERAFFSKELHDGIGPLLSAVKLYLQWSEKPKPNKSKEEIIHKAGDILDDALTSVKEISNKLSPHLLTYYGLTSAIQSFVDRVDESSAIRIIFESDVTRRLDFEIEAAIYRVTIECINNTVKHALADNITIRLNDAGNQIHLRYKDDGIGFDLKETLANQRGLGLFNLQNRIQTIGGEITLFSEPGKGVDYEIVVNI
ncbi:MAG TPA: PAS domain S-box protein, partial [Prolixibacteraceae bacterium]